MSDEKVFGMLSRAFLPAVIVASVFWLMNTFEMRASVFNMPLLIGCYATGAAVLLYAEKGVGVEKEHRLGFYSAYLALVLAGAALGAAMLRA